MMSQPLPVIPLEYEHPQVAAVARPGRALRVCVILAWAACVLAWMLIVGVDVISVIATGPIIALLAGMVAVRGLIERRAGFTVLGAAHLGICLLFIVLVNLFRWSPGEAQKPFTVIGALHVVASGLGSAWVMMPSHWRHRRPHI